MRIHASHKKDRYEQQYSDLQLFFPWRDEREDLHLDNEDKCIQKFNKLHVTIFAMKRKLLPYSSINKEMNEFEKISKENTRASHIYDALDAEFEKDNSDAEGEESEIIPRPQFDFDINEDPHVERNEKGEGKYKSLLLRAEEERLEMARTLVPEQMMVLQEVVKFCKMLTIPNSSIAHTNSHLQLIVHGGAGTGKSKTVKACAQWAEKLLRKA